ncbi:preprotein translocase subunit SecY [Lactonifactor longoviformis]|uniref:Protein translocase subunit SecY n=1 Tax=Lactonifactor longoviformis DSM 17459 TaxID=1122155 RepID=A0A1M4UAT2_9CLOT|nr:preprotein translocase subunit SecY [Lactonifactor longoviformis]POP32717.1 preprotein translocase subunit SecY [Lactonifactor longoviformis]SHE53660.1 protein translocase subunit secY/sec61 alpha [Lactonifactor longoviformis DSM 17459]
MLKTLQNAFKVKDIRRRILYVLMMLVVIRIGSQLPIPGTNPDFFKNWFAQQSGDAFNFFDAFTGGSFTQMSIFALSITPYITSSIIIQLLTIAIPKLEEMQRDGEDGRKKLTAITRYVTVGLSIFQSVAMAIGFKGNIIDDFNFVNAAVVVVCLTAGSAMLMWIGEQITEKGVGNGISIVLMINIVSRIPSDLMSLFESFVKGKTIARGALAAVIILAIILIVIVLVLILNGGERKIPVQYSKKMQGRKMVGGQSTFIPLKVNTSGVIPIIFASSLMSFPTIIAAFLGKTNGTGIGSQIMKALTSNNWCNPSQPVYSLGLLLYIVLVIFFAYFYTSITFNPLEIADNMKKQGGFIPGIRPGKPTTEYLNKILNYIIFIGATGLIIVAVIPIFFNGVFGANVSFGGTSIIIVVGVVLETIKQVESMMLVRNYKGFLND